MSDTTIEKKNAEDVVSPHAYAPSGGRDEEVGTVNGQLHTDLKSRHMQMIAIGKGFPRASFFSLRGMG